MKVKELFKVIDANVFCSYITIVDYNDSRSIKTFKYPQDGRTYVNGVLNQFGKKSYCVSWSCFGNDELIILQLR